MTYTFIPTAFPFNIFRVIYGTVNDIEKRKSAPVKQLAYNISPLTGDGEIILSEHSSLEPTQQLSTYLGINWAQVDRKKRVIIEKTNRRMFFPKNATPKLIMPYVVAFKNSFDGDIFYGVGPDGSVSGLNLSESKLVDWR